MIVLKLIISNLLQLKILRWLKWKGYLCFSSDEGMAKSLQGRQPLLRIDLQNLLNEINKLEYLLPLTNTIIQGYLVYIFYLNTLALQKLLLLRPQLHDVPLLEELAKI